MGFIAAAQVIVVVHFAALAYLMLGGFLVWRRTWTAVPHLMIVLWSMVQAAFPQIACPLTFVEKWLRVRGGQAVDDRDFIETYVQGVLYPEHHVNRARAVVLALLLVSYAGLFGYRWLRSRARRAAAGMLVQPSAAGAPRPIYQLTPASHLLTPVVTRPASLPRLELPRLGEPALPGGGER